VVIEERQRLHPRVFEVRPVARAVLKRLHPLFLQAKQMLLLAGLPLRIRRAKRTKKDSRDSNICFQYFLKRSNK
jgi:hypothetical protein